MNCLICEKELYSEISFGCKMCGMPLDKNQKIFCCKSCKKKYSEINPKRKVIYRLNSK